MIGAADVIEVWEERPGLWRWRFRAEGDHTEILSNETYRTLHEAVSSARVAYPEVPMARLERSRTSVLPYVVAGLLGTVVVGLLAWWMMRRATGTRRPLAPDRIRQT